MVDSHSVPPCPTATSEVWQAPSGWASNVILGQGGGGWARALPSRIGGTDTVTDRDLRERALGAQDPEPECPKVCCVAI